MKNSLLILSLILFSLGCFAQNETTVLGEFCYYEQIDGQKSEGIAMPYNYHNRIELKFKSGYQITVKVEEKQELINLIQKYKSKNTTSKILLGEYKPESISRVPSVKGKYLSVIDIKQSISLFYDGKKIIIEIPELTDMFGSGTSPNHTIFISCIKEVLECLKK
jgi:hypothetical protein